MHWYSDLLMLRLDLSFTALLFESLWQTHDETRQSWLRDFCACYCWDTSSISLSLSRRLGLTTETGTLTEPGVLFIYLYIYKNNNTEPSWSGCVLALRDLRCSRAAAEEPTTISNPGQAKEWVGLSRILMRGQTCGM